MIWAEGVMRERSDEGKGEGVMTYCLLIKNEIHTLNQQYR
jgi:hypothetical protein